jgi:hypothetical protein
LAEPGDYLVAFQGDTEAVSSDGYVLALPDVLYPVVPLSEGTPTGSGFVVSILSGPDAGEWFPVAQQFGAGGGDWELLMEDPMPQLPAGAPYEIEVTGGNFVDDSYIGNTINLTGKISTGLDVVGGNSFGLRVIGNDFIGASDVQGAATGTAIGLFGIRAE